MCYIQNESGCFCRENSRGKDFGDGMAQNQILFIHQSAEMYGSDRVLLDLIVGLDRRRYHAVVLLPEEGLLADELRAAGAQVHIGPVCKISRATLSPLGMLRFLSDIVGSYRCIAGIAGETRPWLVHSNTLAVFGGAVWARLNRVPHLWHVHEIILSPIVAKKMLPFLLRLLADRVVCNSRATAAWVIGEQPKLKAITSIIWNGLSDSFAASAKAGDLRSELDIPRHHVLIGLVGRINRWKGHTLLLRAAEKLAARGVSNFTVLFVGGVASGYDYVKEQLQREIANSSAKAHIRVLDFHSNISAIWAEVDIGAVPSTEPEPFGVVALEAMALGKPVVAAAHGGLVDIVVPGETGILFVPRDEDSLADALQELVSDGEKRRRMGEAGRIRQKELFSFTAYVKAFHQIYEEVEAGRDG